MSFLAEYIDKANLRLRRDADEKSAKKAEDDGEYEMENEDSDKPKQANIYGTELQNQVKELNYDIK